MTTESSCSDELVERNVWLEEYKSCACSFVAKVKRDLPGYCEKHGNSASKRMRLPMKIKESEFGYAGH